MQNNLNYSLSGQARLFVTENDTIVKDTGFIKNMILNQGMDEVSNRPIAELFCCCAIGTGSRENRKTNIPDTSSFTSGNGFDANLINTKANRNANLITFSGAHPTASVIRTTDINNTIYIVDDGYYRIVGGTGLTSSISCSILNIDGTVPTGSSSTKDYTIYFTNQSDLSAEVYRIGTSNDGNNYLPALNGTYGTNCTTAVYGNSVTHRRQYIFNPALFDTPIIREVGFTWLPFSNAPGFFSRIRLTEGISGSAISLLSGQILNVIYELNVVMNPSSPTSSSVDLSGSIVNGVTQLELYGLSSVSSSGLTTYLDDGLHGNEPYFFNQKSKYSLPSSYNGLYIFTSTNSSSHSSWGTNTNRNTNYITKSIEKAIDYTPVLSGSNYGYSLIKVATFNDLESNNSNWRSFGIGVQNQKNLISCVFDSQQNKQNGYLLSISQSFTWNRNLN